VIRRKGGVRLDPSGVLWLTWDSAQGTPAEAVRKVLLELHS